MHILPITPNNSNYVFWGCCKEGFSTNYAAKEDD